jgi:UDP-glucose 4-epimerase
MRVLVTGGAGYIGSVVTEELVRCGHHVVVYDNLSKGHRRAVSEGAVFVNSDLGNGRTLRKTLASSRIEAVIHMAAHSLVEESVANPARFYQNNLARGLALLEAMHECGVRHLVFSSTAAIYGEPKKCPIEEDDLPQPSNPYGESKLAFERALYWYGRAYGLTSVSLRYFNAAGATGLHGEDHREETHLIPIALQAAAGKRNFVPVYGTDYPTRDGTCVRDYIHVVDLARAHILALAAPAGGSSAYNLGCGGIGYTVQEVMDIAREVSGVDIPVKYHPRRSGDPSVLIAANDKIQLELGWKPEYTDLRQIIGSAWDWLKRHPDGYQIVT